MLPDLTFFLRNYFLFIFPQTSFFLSITDELMKVRGVSRSAIKSSNFQSLIDISSNFFQLLWWCEQLMFFKFYDCRRNKHGFVLSLWMEEEVPPCKRASNKHLLSWKFNKNLLWHSTQIFSEWLGVIKGTINS